MPSTIPNQVLTYGVRISSLRFGTAKLHGYRVTETIQSAIRSGYRLIDTAFNYRSRGRSEALIGLSI